MNIKRQVCRNVTIMGIIILAVLAEGNVSAKQYVMMERPKVGLEFSYEFNRDKRSGPDIDRTDTSMTYTETLDVATEGWVYHPALLIYSLELSPEWEQMSEESSGTETVRSRSFLEGYSADATILQYKPYTLNIFANRQSSRIFNNFAGITKTETDTQGATLLLKYKELPTSLNYTHLESTTTGFYDADRESDRVDLSIRHSVPKSNTALAASYSDSKQTTRTTFTDTLDRTAELRNTYKPDAKKNLHQSLRYHDTLGSTVDIERHHFSEHLRWDHAKNLSTNYRLTYDRNEFDRDEFGKSSTETKFAGFNLNHFLYENLRTLIDVYGTDSRFTGEKVVEYGSEVNFNYQRRIPWGVLRLTMGQNYSITERDKSARFVNVIEEPVTLTTGSITLLDNTSVDTGSIVVTSDPGNATVPFTVYDEVDDYTITELNDTVEIQCVLGGQIDIDFDCGTGAPVLVSYRYFTEPGSDVSLHGQSYGIGFDLWSVLTLFSSYSHREQRLLDGFQPGNLIDEETYTTGANLDLKWSRTSIQFKDLRSTSLPRRNVSIQEIITLRPRDRLFVSATGNYTRTKFKDTGDAETATGISSDLEMLVSRRAKFSVEGFWRELTGRAQDITETGFSTMFRWSYRAWRGSMGGRFSIEEDNIVGQTFEKYEMTFKIERLLL